MPEGGEWNGRRADKRGRVDRERSHRRQTVEAAIDVRSEVITEAISNVYGSTTR